MDKRCFRARSYAGEVTDDDPRLSSLQWGLADACSRFLGSFEGSGDNIYAAYGPLTDIVVDYQTAITGKLTELLYTDIHRHGVRLQNHMQARGRNVPRLDSPPPLEDEQEAAINDLLTFHANFMLSNRDGEELHRQNERAQMTVEERVRLWSHSLSEAVDLSDHATDRAKAVLRDLNQPNENDAASNRHALLVANTNRNFLTATGEAATGKDFSNIGVEAMSAASQSAGRFLLKNEELVKQLSASTSYGLAWLRTRPTLSQARAGAPLPAYVGEKPWAPGRVFRDIDEPWCPEMVVIPAGEFLMGSPEDEEGRRYNEGPQHLVTIKRSFALGRYPVTFEEFDHYCEETGGDKPDDRGWGRGRRPVINVSMDDACDYCTWLSGVTCSQYWLPTEGEWEYACRARSQTAYFFGDKIREEQANFGLSVRKTSQVGVYPANAFGLFDMHGNVWEWSANAGYLYEPVPTLGPSPNVVMRGSSWRDGALSVRSACRHWKNPYYRDVVAGFRCARVLEQMTS